MDFEAKRIPCYRSKPSVTGAGKVSLAGVEMVVTGGVVTVPLRRRSKVGQ
jgi:TRAP-type uncharacterized transport system fused permease subunit